MSGRLTATKTVVGPGWNSSSGITAAANDPQPFVPPVWEGRAGFGGNNCVCTEARLYSPIISSRAGTLTCSFEEDSFPVVVQFGRGVEE